MFEELAAAGFALEAGQLGENILTAGIDLLTLPRGTLLELGNGEARAVLEVTGLRNPCRQIEAFRPGLLAQLGRRSTDGGIERLAGIMCTAITSGTVRAGDSIAVTRPEAPHHALEPV